MGIIKGEFEKAQFVAQKEKNIAGIGTYKEKTLHIFLKNYFEPDCSLHEISVGKKCADILNEHGIIEIQTRSLGNLCSKLESFLPEHKVTVVYPYAATKWLCWLDPETGEISLPRKSPRKLSFYDSFYELYKIRKYLSHPNLSIYLIGLEIQETRLLNGWSADKKKGSERFDRFPISVVEKLHLKTADDFIWLIPANIPSPFTSSDYGKLAKLKPRYANTALNVLESIDIIKCTGKQGRRKLYEIV